jgi:hypothetical protein
MYIAEDVESLKIDICMKIVDEDEIANHTKVGKGGSDEDNIVVNIAEDNDKEKR